MLSNGDEFPIHQTPEPIAFSGTDRNFYDRYFFCGYLPDGDGYFAMAFGVYPHLNIADAHFSILRDGVQHCLHTSRILGGERMDLQVGPIRIEVIEPLNIMKVTVAESEGISAELICTGRSFPLQEPRFTHRNGSRTVMDVTRFTQNVRWSGWAEVDGKRQNYDGGLGTRDRSWGVRPIGAQDMQPVVPAQFPQFYWIWAPTNFPNLSMMAHANEDQNGDMWNKRAVLAPDGCDSDGFIGLNNMRFEMDWKNGTRNAAKATLNVQDGSGRDHKVEWEPIATFHMKGIGYGHPEWGHGGWKGELVQEREDFRPDELDLLVASNIHIQALSKARHEGAGSSSDGIGIVEQLAIGPHVPSGFEQLLDGAK